MPRPVDHHTAYRPGLDGVRALAVALVILFHFGVAGFQGGLLGVGVFFTLSGYLITGLLVAGWQRRRSWGLNTFWLRRARRLLPAVVVVLVTCMAVVLITDRPDLPRRAVEALAALLYVANWHTIAVGDSYFVQVHGPGPFEHLWSLSVEEQFYLVWPLLLGLLFTLTRARIRVAAAITALLAAGSFVLLALLAHPGVDNTRAYEGTDTRAGGLLVGAVLAMLWMQPGAESSDRKRTRRVALEVLGLLGLAGIAWLVTHTNQNSLSTYRWGLALLSVCTAVVLAAVADSRTLLGRFFGLAPLRWVGERSYGLYLWHLPVIVFTPADVLAAHPVVRALVQAVIMVGLAAASWQFIEDPIRTHGLRGVLRSAKGGLRRPGREVAGHTSSGVMVLGASVFLPVAVLAMLLPRALPREPRSDVAAPPPVQAAAPSATSSGSGPARTTPSPSRPAHTTCSSVILVGDSTSEGLYGKASALSPEENLQGQLADVGVRRFTAEISGARSIIESYEGQPSGEQVIKQHVADGYHGCWIISLGNVDAATVAKYAPDTTSIPDRIDTVMRTIPEGQPVMWQTTRTILQNGDFRESAYPPWNQGLVKACSRYPDMRVFDWAGAYRTSWIGPDGIHATPTGYRHKAHLMAQAIALGFPAGGHAPGSCVIGIR